jgi:hypothetical protein
LEIADDRAIYSEDEESSKSNASQSADISPRSPSTAVSPAVERGLSPDIAHDMHNVHLENSFIDGEASSKTRTEADVNDIVAGLKKWSENLKMKPDESAGESANRPDHLAEAFAGLIEKQVKDQIRVSTSSFYDVLHDIIVIIDSLNFKFYCYIVTAQ